MNVFQRLIGVFDAGTHVSGPSQFGSYRNRSRDWCGHRGWTFIDLRDSKVFHTNDYTKIVKTIVNQKLTDDEYEIHATGNAYQPEISIKIRHYHKQ